MNHNDFQIGGTFWCAGRQWRCTDLGARTVIAIRIDGAAVGSTNPSRRHALSRTEAEAEGWFNGPPYAVFEVVFDEDDLPACSVQPDTEAVTEPDPVVPADELSPDLSGQVQAEALREQARVGGLRFEAYLPRDLAGWLLDLIARGVFTDPAEAVFSMLGEQRDLEPHTDLREELLRRRCQKALDDSRPSIPYEEVMAKMKALLAEPQPQPALWTRRRL